MATDTKQKHTTWAPKDKLEVFNCIDLCESATKLAFELGVGKATIINWRKTCAKIDVFYD